MPSGSTAARLTLLPAATTFFWAETAAPGTATGLMVLGFWIAAPVTCCSAEGVTGVAAAAVAAAGTAAALALAPP